VVREIERSLAVGSERGSFRVVHYSIQADHGHFLVEAAGREALGRGMKSLAARFARAVNRALERKGPVLAERYHLRVLRSPRQVRNALAYVLLNARKHHRRAERRKGTPSSIGLDAASSSRWFDGFTRWLVSDRTGPIEVARPRLWVLRTGWRRAGGLIDPATVPGG